MFKIAAGTGTITTLASFNSTNGGHPEGSLTLDSSGNLYGTTYGGGANGVGTVFELTKVASATAAPEPGALGLMLPFGAPAILFGLRRRKRIFSPVAEAG